MPKREHETEAEYKARKKAKKEKKKAKKRQKLVDNEKSAAPKGNASTGNTEKEKKSKSKKQSDESTVDTGKKSNTKQFTSFSDAPFAKPIQQALHDAGFSNPSPIQARAWPVALAGKDLIAVAKTGSGKTLGFLLPIFHKISTNITNAPSNSSVPSPTCLVLSPTRELAIQIHGECIKFGLNTLQI